MATISLEGTGTSISFSASGFSADIITVDLNERARQTIETTHLGTQGAKTYKPGEVVDLGEMIVVVDHNPSELQLVGYPVESITINYPLQAGEVVPTKIPLTGYIVAQGEQQMQMDKRMVTKLKIKLTNLIEASVFVPGPPPVLCYDDLKWETSNSAVSPSPTIASAQYSINRSLPGFSKYYFEIEGAGTNDSLGLLQVGIRDLGVRAFQGTYFGQSSADYSIQLLRTTGISKYNNGAGTLLTSQSAASGKRVGFYVDPVAGTIGLIAPNGADLGVIYTVGTGLRNAIITMGNSYIPGGAPSVTATVHQDPISFQFTPPSGYSPIVCQTLTALSTIQVSSLNSTGTLFGGGATYQPGVYEVHYTGVGGWNISNGSSGFFFQSASMGFTGSPSNEVCSRDSDGGFAGAYTSLASMQAVGFKNRVIISLASASTIKASLLDGNYFDNSDQGGGCQFTLYQLA